MSRIMSTPQQPDVSVYPRVHEKLTYSTLGPDTIRILTILAGRDDEPIKCTLSQKSGTPRKDLSYDALSYMWGPPEPCHDISVNGMKASVRQNLFAALKAIRNKDRPHFLWVDALCINQEDIPERNTSVVAMGRIYREAESVVVWLGEESEDSDIAFDGLNSVKYLGSLAPVPLHGSLPNALNLREIHALVALCYRPYWRRVWIIQEILSASNLVVLCGTKRVEHPYFSQGIVLLDKSLWGILARCNTNASSKERERANTLMNLDEARKVSPGAEILSFYNALTPKKDYRFQQLLNLCSACKSQSQEVLDRIYGFIGILGNSEVGRWEHISPDYTKTPSQLYLDVFILSNQKLSRITEPSTRSGLLDFTNTLQAVIGDPLWTEVPGEFNALGSICRESQLDEMSRARREIWIAGMGVITEISAIIPSSERMLVHSIFFKKRNTESGRFKSAVLATKLSNLSIRDFHRTQTIRVHYGRQPAGYYTSDHSSYRPISEAVECIGVQAKSTGNCRAFTSTHDLVGIASCDIQTGDILCESVISNVFVVIRPEPSRAGFTIIGRAMWLNMGDGATPSSRTVRNSTENLGLDGE